MLRHKPYTLKPYKVGLNTFHALYIGEIRIGRVAPNLLGITHPVDNYPYLFNWEIKLYGHWERKDTVIYGGSIEGCAEAAMSIFREWLNEILY